jgi:hypothetical protein
MSNISRRDWLVLEHGTLVTVNTNGYIACCGDVKPFIGTRCRFDKVTKAGLVSIYIDGDVRKKISVAKSNVNLIMQ